MLGFGVIGYIMERAGMPTAPMVIGLVLGMLLDITLNQSLMIGYGSWGIFLESSIAVVLLLIAALSVLQATPFFRVLRNALRRERRTVGADDANSR